MLLFLLVNFVTAFKMFTISVPNAILTSFTSVLTPSIYPSDNPVRTIAFIAKFHIFNSIITTVFIALCALVQFFTAAKLDKAWNSLDRSEASSLFLGNITSNLQPEEKKDGHKSQGEQQPSECTVSRLRCWRVQRYREAGW